VLVGETERVDEVEDEVDMERVDDVDGEAGEVPTGATADVRRVWRRGREVMTVSSIGVLGRGLGVWVFVGYVAGVCSWSVV
jgi:hypothetical protein